MPLALIYSRDHTSGLLFTYSAYLDWANNPAHHSIDFSKKYQRTSTLASLVSIDSTTNIYTQHCTALLDMALYAQQEKQIREWNRSPPAPVNGCVHELISSIAGQQPDATAVHAFDGDFSYANLDALAEKLAFRLMELGTTPRSIIPIFFEKNKWTPVAMLAAIKTGSAVIALDINHPLERLRSIVQQAHSAIIISSNANAQQAALLGKAEVMVLGDDFLATTPVPQSLPLVSPSDIVYISFTSGVRCSNSIHARMR